MLALPRRVKKDIRIGMDTLTYLDYRVDVLLDMKVETYQIMNIPKRTHCGLKKWMRVLTCVPILQIKLVIQNIIY